MINKISEIDQRTRAKEVAIQLKRAAEERKAIVPFAAERLPDLWRESAKEAIFLDLKDYAQVLEHAPEDQVVSVETGISLAALNQILAKNNQWLPLSHGSNSASLLEAIITGDGGALEHHYGGPRRLVLGLTLALSSGEVIRTGGRVVKNVTGYDLTRLAIGSYGVFGVPVDAFLRLHARPESFVTFIFCEDKPHSLLHHYRDIDKLGLPVVACELVDRRLLSKEHVPGNKSSAYLLLLRLAGLGQLISSSSSLLSDIAAREHFRLSEMIEGESEEKLWVELNDVQSQERYCQIELSASTQSALFFWDNANWLKNPFTYRPGVGRFKFFLADEKGQENLIAKLKEYAQTSLEPITISYANGQYLRKIERLAASAVVEETLSRLLKEKLDPANSLNPFVCFGSNSMA